MHLHAIINESVEDLKKCYMLAAPTIVARFFTVLISFMLWDRPSTPSTNAFISIVAAFIILYAHGVTLAMARELLETGATSITTATDTARRFFVPLFSLSLSISLMVLIGIRFFVMPGLALAFVLIYALPVSVYEGFSVFDAMKRSFHLAMTHKHDTFVLLSTLVLSILALALISAMLSIIPILGQLVAVLLSGAYGAVATVVIARVYTELSAR